MNKNVLIINQSAELYGADKALLELLEDYPKGYNPIVVLHEDGPLKEILLQKNIQVIDSSVIKVKRGILKPSFFFNLPFEIFKSIRKIRKELNGKQIHLIHSNATSVFIGAFYSFIFRIPHIWHVHEIIEKPKRIANLYPIIINFFSTKVIFNSKATEKHFFSIFPKIKKKSSVIYNGINRNVDFLSDNEKNKLKTTIFNWDEKSTIITLIGRISSIKGQLVLFKAFCKLFFENKNIQLVFIGSFVKDKSEYYDNLINEINNSNLSSKITFVDFQKNIWPFYDASDIIIVPSTEPESFGLVAAEALLSKKPVIASKIGALPEIIINNKTGLLFESNNENDLASKIFYLINNPNIKEELCKNGEKHVLTNFNRTTYSNSFLKIYESLS